MANPSAGPNNNFHSASLYVGDLKPEVTEALLFKIFNAVGPVASIRVCRDAVTRQSLGYAYVNFHNVNDAERALDNMNYTNIRNKPCRIMWSQRNPSLRKSGVGNIFVKNLDKSIDNKTLYDTFSMFGDILSCRVATDENNQSRGYGFVHYARQEFANRAIEKVNGMTIADKQVYVAPFETKKHRGPKKRIFTNVYLKAFPKTWSEEKLAEVCMEYGPTNSTYLSTDENGESKGFGFVNFETAEAAERCVSEMNGKKYDGCTDPIFAARAQKKKEREVELKDKREKRKSERMKKYDGVNLYVKNLNDSVGDKELEELFKQYGVITSAKVMLGENNKSRCFGFVCFQTKDEASRAMTDMNSKIIGGKPLYVGLAQRKDQRRHALEMQARRRAQKSSASKSRRGGGRGGIPGGRGNFYNNQMSMVPTPGNMPNRRINPMPARAPWYNTGYTGMMGNNVRMPMANNYGPGSRGRGMGGMHQPNPAAAAASAVAPLQAYKTPGGPVPTHPADPPNKLTAASLTNADPTQQKQMIGERIFPLVQSFEPRLAGKITGMLLEMDNTELLHLIEDQEALMQKVNEALAVLKQYNEQNTVAME